LKFSTKINASINEHIKYSVRKVASLLGVSNGGYYV